jgi:small subunit ribosomal protein S3
MGRKVHPIGFRLGINQPWGGRWFAEGNTYRQQLHQDFAIRTLLIGKVSKGGWAASEKVRELRKQMPDAVRDGKAGISRIDVERTPGKVRISIHTAKPGILIGRKGEGVKKIRQALEALVGKKIELDIKEISSPDTDAMLVAKNIADQLERRIAYRRAMKRAIQQAIKQGAEDPGRRTFGRCRNVT